jgi:hypothetical protein
MRFVSLGPAAALCLTALGVLSGCGGSSTAIGNNPDPANPPQVTRGQYGPIQFTLSTTKSVFAVGETVPFVFTVTNTSSESLIGFVQDRPRREIGDFIEAEISQTREQSQRQIIETPVFVRIWTKDGLSYGGSGAIHTVSFNPGESRRFEFSWSQKGNDLVRLPPTVEGMPGGYQNVEGSQVTPGTYTINAYASAWFYPEYVTAETIIPVPSVDITIR